MNKERIGENAGIVWRVLHNNRCSWEELVKATELNPLEAGWRGKTRFASHRNGASCTSRCIMNVIIDSAPPKYTIRGRRSNMLKCINGLSP